MKWGIMVLNKNHKIIIIGIIIVVFLLLLVALWGFLSGHFLGNAVMGSNTNFNYNML